VRGVLVRDHGPDHQHLEVDVERARRAHHVVDEVPVAINATIEKARWNAASNCAGSDSGSRSLRCARPRDVGGLKVRSPQLWGRSTPGGKTLLDPPLP
jgi:hypothetical protein